MGGEVNEGFETLGFAQGVIWGNWRILDKMEEMEEIAQGVIWKN